MFKLVTPKQKDTGKYSHYWGKIKSEKCQNLQMYINMYWSIQETNMRRDISSSAEMIAIPGMSRHSSDCVSLLSLEDREIEDEGSLVLKQGTDQSDRKVSFLSL